MTTCRVSRLCVFVALIVVTGTRATAADVEPGDRVHVTQESPLRVGPQIRATVGAGTVLVVRTVSPGWLWVSATKDGAHAEGWLSAGHVATLAEAVTSATERIESNASDARTWLDRARLYVASAEYPQAIEDFSKAIRLRPELVDAYVGRAEARLLLGEAELSLADCHEAIRRNARSAEAYRRRGDAHFAAGNLDEALAAYDRALALAPPAASVSTQQESVTLAQGVALP